MEIYVGLTSRGLNVVLLTSHKDNGELTGMVGCHFDGRMYIDSDWFFVAAPAASVF